MLENVKKIDIIRQFPYATVKLKIHGEELFTFKNLSSRISERSLNLVLPVLIEAEREKRIKAAVRKEELRVIKERKAMLDAIWEVADGEQEEEQRDPVEKQCNSTKKAE